MDGANMPPKLSLHYVFRGLEGKWVSIRNRSIWPMGIALSVGLTFMWIGNIGNLRKKGGFAGIAGWLIPGIIVVGMRDWLMTWRLVQVWSNAKWNTRLRLLIAQWSPTTGNFLVNAYAIYLIIDNLSTGLLQWGRWDKWCLGVAGVTLVLMTALKWRLGERMSTKLYITGVAIGTRVFQQIMLVKSPQLAVIPWLTPVGLIIIASVMMAMSLIEYMAAHEEGSVDEVEAQLILVADGANFGAAVVLLVGWGLQ
jgi:hypothetical protein